jgi:hypothetical protein
MQDTPAPAQVMVRGIDPVVWRQVKAAAALRGLTLGQLLNAILREWLAQPQNGKPKP